MTETKDSSSIEHAESFEDPYDNSLQIKSAGPKGTQHLGSIKGLKEGKWYEIVISQEKQLVKINFLQK